MEAEGVRCPNCGGSDIQFLPGGSVRCEHCGSYFADPTRKASGDQPSIHVHVHNEPVEQPLPAQNEYAPPQPPPQPVPPQPMPPQPVPAQPVYMPPPYPQRKNGGCLKAFIILLILGVLGFIGLAILGYFIEEMESSSPAPSSYGTSPRTAPPRSTSASSYSFKDVEAAIVNRDINRLRTILKAQPSLANAPGEVTLRDARNRTLSLMGATPLHVAAFYGNEAAVRLLLDNGAIPSSFADKVNDPNAAYTPTQIAKVMGHDNIVRILNHATYGG